MPLFTGITIGAITISAATETAIATSIVVSALSMAASLIMKAAQGKPADPGRTVTFRDAAAARRVIYGTCRVGGVPTFLHLSASTASSDHPNQYLVTVYTLCGHEINALVATLFDGAPVVWGGWDVNPRMPLFYQESGIYHAQLWGDWKLGKAVEPAFPGAVAITTRDNSSLWTAAHRQDGCASVALVLSWNSDVFPNGPPATSFDVQGKKLYDPRTGLTAFSNNAALAIYDFLTNKEYGFGSDPSDVNTASVIAAANTCDENVSLKAGGSEHRYQVNGMFSTDGAPNDILRSLAAAMAGYVVFSQGQWYLIAGIWNAPTVSLTDDDLRAPMQIRSLTPKRDLCNAVRGTFFAALRNWQKVDFPPVVHPEHICDDSGYPNAVQRGQWLTATSYAVGDCAIDSAARILTGKWAAGKVYQINDYVSDTYLGLTKTFVCTQNHTASAAGPNPPTVNGNEPGVGENWAPYWADVTATYSEFRGGVYICTVAHTSAALTEPSIGANWLTVWVEAKEYIWKDLALDFTTSSPMAQRLAKIELERTRNQTTAVLKCKLSAFQLQPGDTFSYSHPRFGWVNKSFVVIQSDFVVDANSGTLGIDLKVQEVSPAIYAWDQTTEEQTLGQPSQPTMPDTEVPRPTPAAYGPGLTWTSTPSSIRIAWNYTGGNAIIMLDQENTTYTPSGNQSITGLAASTAFKLYPCYNRPLGVFTCQMSDGVGAPLWLEVPSVDPNVLRARTAEWQRAGNVPLALLPLDVSTPASGTGGGGGGGDGGCLEIGTFVSEKVKGVIRVEEVRKGDRLWSEHGRYLEVLNDPKPVTHDQWIDIDFNNGARIPGTAGHTWTLNDGCCKRSLELSFSDAIPTPTGITYPVKMEYSPRLSMKVPITVEEPHNFYASLDGEHWVLNHNIMGTQ